MITAIKNNTVSIDGSYTGTGKTYTTSAVCAQLGLTPIVICPKSIINTWKSVLESFGVKYISIVNYEAIRSYKYIGSDGRKIVCAFIKKGEKSHYEWDLSQIPNPENVIIVFDEVHRCKNHKSLNGKLLLSCKKIKTLMLSATLCDKNSDFGIFGMMLGFYNSYKHGKSWFDSILREDRNQFGKNKVNTLHKYLFPHKGSKMSLDDLDESYPMNQVSIDCYNLDLDQLKKVNRLYSQIKSYYDINNNNNDYSESKYESKNNGKDKLVELNNLRQQIENIKVDIITDLTQTYLDQNRSIAIFVNYVSTFELISDYLKKHDISYAEINGKQDHDERDININKFQSNEVRVIVCMIQAGGTSISLHDTTGRFPRVSIISPSYSRIELIQTLGRIFRNGVKSPCLQKIVYCAGTCEENIANILKQKRNVLDKITDEDINIENTFTNNSGTNNSNLGKINNNKQKKFSKGH
jgi:SNF2 family DNA or RNA helicase